MIARAALTLTALLPLAACPAGKAADAVKSDQPKVAGGPVEEGTGKASCAADKNYEMLAVDWEPEQRGDLEVAMKQGVVAVSYDCDHFRVLDDCAAEGSYGFIGMARKEKVVAMKNADEVKANLPLHGIKWIADAEIGGERGTSLDAAMVMVGARKTGRRALGRDELEGDCDGATHYVSSATVGAFVLATGSSAEISGAASFFGKGAGGKSSSAEKVHNKDGSLEDCMHATPDAKKPPAQCSAVLRLKIKALADSGAAATAAAAKEQDVGLDVVSCPAGTVWAGGSCVAEAGAGAHQCTPGDAADCQAQCDAGDAESCSILGSMYWHGQGVAKDWARSVELHRAACEKNVARSCRYAGNSLRTGRGVKKNRRAARELLSFACDLGDGLGCVELGRLYVDMKKGSDALTMFRRACYGGEYEGCSEIGVMYEKGAGGLRKNPKIAAKFFEKGCKEGSLLACTELADAYAAGRGVKRDERRAAELKQKACNRGYEAACGR